MKHNAAGTQQKVLHVIPSQIRQGIFQWDSLSPLPFCILLNQLTHELNRSERKIHHLLYVYGGSEIAK
jgi:hypothetical protein